MIFRKMFKQYKQAMLALALLLILPMFAIASEDAGVVKSVKGQAIVLRDGGNKINANIGTVLKSSDTLMTEANSSVGVTLRDGTMLSIGANSTLELSKFTFNDTKQTGELDATIKKGTLAVISGKLAKTSRDHVAYRTPNAILGVRGTAFVIEVGEDGELVK